MNLDDMAPEAVFIVALMGSGDFSPGSYGVDKSMARSHTDVWQWAENYQQQTGVCPSKALLKRKFPAFPWIDDLVEPSWAAQELAVEHGIRTMRKVMTDASARLGQHDLPGAYGLLRDYQMPSVGRSGVEAMDALEDEPPSVRRHPLPWDSLSRVVGGLAAGDLWYVSGRPGDGKSWFLVNMVGHLLTQEEVSVCFFSLEMPARDVSRRLAAVVTDLPRLNRKMMDGDRRAEVEAVQAARKRIKGRMVVVDPSKGTCDPMAVAAEARRHDVVVVDHTGLMRTSSGSRVVEDWRAMHAVSNELKEIALSTSTVVLAASQLNRMGDTSTPSTTHLAQSDALGQDADVVLAIRRPARGAATVNVVKNRRGTTARFHTAFRPEEGAFPEISKEDVDAIAAEEG